MEKIYSKQFPMRKRIRLSGYDYSTPGAYFVTICVKDNLPLLGECMNNEMVFSKSGKVVHQFWSNLPHRFTEIEIDQFIIMPNHLHGIIVINERSSAVLSKKDASVGVQFIEPVLSQYVAKGSINQIPTVGEIIRAFKAATTYTIRKELKIDFAWQRNYYDRIIRNERELDRIREYILNNPLQGLNLLNP